MATNNFKFSQRSENNLKGVHPDLVAVVRRALALKEHGPVVIVSDDDQNNLLNFKLVCPKR